MTHGIGSLEWTKEVELQESPNTLFTASSQSGVEAETGPAEKENSNRAAFCFFKRTILKTPTI